MTAPDRPDAGRPAPFIAALRVAGSPFACWLAVLLYAGIIFCLSSLPLRPPRVPLRPFPHADKVIHLLEFAVLSLLICRALTVSSETPPAEPANAPRSVRWIPWMAIALTVFYAATDEIHQGFVPPRTPNVADFIADAIGAVLGAAAWPWTLKRWPWVGPRSPLPN